MKTSRYNYSTHLSDGTFLLFNFYTLTLLAFDGKEAKIVEVILKEPGANYEKSEAAKLQKLLIDRGFVIDDGIDELALLKIFHHASHFQRNNLGLTVTPTLGCNFSCIYCYETGKMRSMDTETEETLYSFVGDRIEEG